jgi:hypothetical protein
MLSHVPDLHCIEGYDPSMVDVSRCCVTRASSFLSVIMVSLTWHMLQVSSPYQPRLFSPALGILSTCVRPLSSTSKRYARGRASPSPTDGHSPAVQLPPLLSIMVEPRSNPTGGCSPAVRPPPSLSSCHRCRCPAAIVVVVQLPSLSLSGCHRCHRPAAIVIVQPPSSSSSRHRRCPIATIIVRCRPLLSWPCGLVRMRGTRCPVSRTCMGSRDTIPRWWTSVDAAYYAHRCSQVVQQDHLPSTCSKRVFTDVKAALISLGSPSHSHCPLLVDVECRFGV